MKECHENYPEQVQGQRGVGLKVIGSIMRGCVMRGACWVKVCCEGVAGQRGVGL